MTEGYNILVEFGGKKLAGRTQDDLTSAARTKDSITKDDQGNRKQRVMGHDISCNCQGQVEETAASDEYMTASELRHIALMVKGDEAVMDFTYSPAGATKKYTGKCVMTNFTESSNSEDIATWSATLSIQGDLAEAAI